MSAREWRTLFDALGAIGLLGGFATCGRSTSFPIFLIALVIGLIMRSEMNKRLRGERITYLAAPQNYSDDGKWWWNGTEWVPVSDPPTRPSA